MRKLGGGEIATQLYGVIYPRFTSRSLHADRDASERGRGEGTVRGEERGGNNERRWRRDI